MKALDTSITKSESDKVAYALETNLHWFALNGIKPGDRIRCDDGFTCIPAGAVRVVRQCGNALAIRCRGADGQWTEHCLDGQLGDDCELIGLVRA